jgi:hypothetical protein
MVPFDFFKIDFRLPQFVGFFNGKLEVKDYYDTLFPATWGSSPGCRKKRQKSYEFPRWMDYCVFLKLIVSFPIL